MVNQRTHDRLLHMCKILFVIYLFVVAYLLFFFEMRTSLAASGELHYNLVPFKEIHRFLTNTEILGTKSVLMNVFGNVLLFLPFGFLLPTLFGRVRGLAKTTLTGFFFSLLVEVLQLISRLGCFDVDDLILNTMGAMVGFLLFAVCIGIRDAYVRYLYRKRMRYSGMAG